MRQLCASLADDPRTRFGAGALVAIMLVAVPAGSVVSAILVVPLAAAAAFTAGLAVSLSGRRHDDRRQGEQRQLNESLDRQVRGGRKLSILDPDTAMLQTWYFQLRVAEEARRCRRYGTSMALVFLKVRDADQPQKPWAHEDEMDFVQLFTRELRSVDLATRIDSGEYAVCLPQTPAQGAHAAALRLLEQSGGYSVRALMALCPRDGLDYESLALKAEVLSLAPPKPDAELAQTPQQLAQLISAAPAGVLVVPRGQTLKAVKARLRRASRRAGVEIRIWDDGGLVRFEHIQRDGADTAVA